MHGNAVAFQADVLQKHLRLEVLQPVATLERCAFCPQQGVLAVLVAIDGVHEFRVVLGSLQDALEFGENLAPRRRENVNLLKLCAGFRGCRGDGGLQFLAIHDDPIVFHMIGTGSMSKLLQPLCVAS